MINESNDTTPSDAIKPVLAALENGKISFDLKTFTSPAKSARQAADLIGCPLGAIVKSLFFVAPETGEYFLILTSGKNRVSEKRLQGQIRQSLVQAEPDVVLEKTGFPIGGVPPLGHKDRFKALLDHDLMQYEQVWASAGAIHSVFGIQPGDLLRLCGAELCEVTDEEA